MHRERLADGREVRGARYQCRWFHESCSTGSCLNIRGKWIDAFIEAEVLNNLAPPSIEMLQRVARDGMTQYEAMVRARQAERHRAESAVAELERQFCAEPEEHVHRRRWLATRTR